MKRLALVLAVLGLVAALPVPGMAADVQVNIMPSAAEVAPPPAPAYDPGPQAAPPPPLEVQNPEMVVVPSGNASVYMIPNVYGVYFYGGHWYRYHNGFWFRSGVYNGAWLSIGTPPGVVVGLAPEYAMVLPPNYYRIPYGHFHSNWRHWNHNYWHRHSWYSHEMRARAERHRHIDRHRSEWSRGHGHRPSGYYHGPARHTPAGRPGHHGPAVHKPGPHGPAVHKPGPHGPAVHKPGPHGPAVHKPGPHGPAVHKPGPHGPAVHKPGPQGPAVHKPAPHGPNKPQHGPQGGQYVR